MIDPNRRAKMVRKVARILEGWVEDVDASVRPKPEPVAALGLQQEVTLSRPCCANCKRYTADGRCSRPRIGTKHQPKEAPTNWCDAHLPKV